MTPRRDNSHEKPETKTDHQQNSTSSVSGTSRTERHSGIPRTKTQSTALSVCHPFPPDRLLSHVTATAVVNILHDGKSHSQQTRGLLTHEWQSLSFVSGLTRLVSVFLCGGAWHSHSCGQTDGWIKMPLGKEVGLSSGHIVSPRSLCCF